MALSQQHRSSLYLTLSPLVGTEEAEALLHEFPATDLETPATKEFVRAEGAITRGELRQEMAEMKGELRQEMAEMTVELRQEMAITRGELREEMAEMKGELRTEFHSELRRQTKWIATIVIAGYSASCAFTAMVVVAATHL